MAQSDARKPELPPQLSVASGPSSTPLGAIPGRRTGRDESYEPGDLPADGVLLLGRGVPSESRECRSVRPAGRSLAPVVRQMTSSEVPNA